MYVGMDETNERRVWDMLLDVCKKHSAQYFYMAPKFPYDLPFNEQVHTFSNLLSVFYKAKDSSFYQIVCKDIVSFI